LIRKSLSNYQVWGGVLLLVTWVSIAHGVARVKANAVDDTALDEKITTFVRAKFGIPDTVKITASPFRRRISRAF